LRSFASEGETITILRRHKTIEEGTAPTVVAYVAVGSNVDPEANIKRALDQLKVLARVTGVSTFYRTAPIERPDQPDYINGVCRIETALSARTLKFGVLKKIEEDLGRVRGADAYASRSIDLDLVLYGEATCDDTDLRIPDPDIRKRTFVAAPLLELAPDLRLPDTGEALSSLPVSRVLGGMTPLDAFSRSLKSGLEGAMICSCDDIAKMIDHAALQPFMTDEMLEKEIQLALACNVASVCIKPYYLKRCAELLKGSSLKASTTIGFPHGGHSTSTKVAEARQALADGGEELDIVVNIGKVLSGAWDYVRDDIRAVVDLTHHRGMKTKVIFENCYLHNAQKIRLCEICGELGADWIKTSTGFGSGGATLDDVKLMREYSPPDVQIKAAGGIRDLDTLLAFRAAGATRIGASATAKILDEFKARSESSESPL
jgi:deoxyribose-phosphate aldolase